MTFTGQSELQQIIVIAKKPGATVVSLRAPFIQKRSPRLRITVRSASAVVAAATAAAIVAAVAAAIATAVAAAAEEDKDKDDDPAAVAAAKVEARHICVLLLTL